MGLFQLINPLGLPVRGLNDSDVFAGPQGPLGLDSTGTEGLDCTGNWVRGDFQATLACELANLRISLL